MHNAGCFARSLSRLCFGCLLFVSARISFAQDVLLQGVVPTASAIDQPFVTPLPSSPTAAKTGDVADRLGPGPSNATISSPAASQADQQTKRILFIIPNFRSVSANVTLPPLSPKQKLKLALADTFDYSSFIFVGITAGVAQEGKSYPEFHQGAAGYGRYYWHGFADSVGSNAFTELIGPLATREDPRFYTLGHGGLFKRAYYAASRLAITRSDDGDTAVNLSEIIGTGAGAGISNLYYPGDTRTWTKTGQKWLTQLGLDGLSNIAKEFWPEINRRTFKGRF